MEARSSKRRRLITISSYVSQQRPDVPATFESLNDDTLTTMLEFVGNKSYAIYAGINKHCREIYLATPGMTKETFLYGYAPLELIKGRIIEERASRDLKLHPHEVVGNEGIAWDLAMREQFNWKVFEKVGKGIVLYNRRDVLDWALEEREKVLLKGICYAAAGEERLDILNEVWNNFEDDNRRGILGGLHDYAVRYGKLNVLKWTFGKGLDINNYWCAGLAAEKGQIHILQWLQEEKGLKLAGELYSYATDGGHLHVFKWLREEELDWDEYTFYYAAKEGNLDILQWLHDEGCPWPEDYCVREDRVKPEALEWLRSNGYGNRLM